MKEKKMDFENLNYTMLNSNAIKHFEIHSKQRVQTLNFFIVMESLFTTGIIWLFAYNITKIFGVFLCFAISFFSVMFYLMDRRMKEMIKSSEKVLMEIEKKTKCDYKYCVFTNTEHHIEEVVNSKYKTPHWSFMLKAIYLFFFIVGIVGIIYFLFSPKEATNVFVYL